MNFTEMREKKDKDAAQVYWRVWNQVDLQAGLQVYDQADRQVWWQVYDQVWRQVLQQVRWRVWWQIGGRLVSRFGIRSGI